MDPSLNGHRISQFYTPKEVATILGVTITSVYKWIRRRQKRGGIPAHNFGSKKHPCYRIPKDKFTEWSNSKAGE